MKSEQAPVKGCKEGFTKKNFKKIYISDDEISQSKKVMYENDYRKIRTEKLNSIFIGNKDFQLELLVEQNYKGIRLEKYELISIFADETRYESQITRKDPEVNQRLYKRS